MPTERLSAESVGVRHGNVSALADVTMTVAAGEVVALVGPNGSGKTTLLRALGGISRPSTGTVRLDGVPVTDLSARSRSQLLAYVGQDEHSDMPFTARETLLLGRSNHHRDWEGYDARDQSVVDDILIELRLEAMAHRTLDRMSGGERQRVLIARALAQRAEIILLDEPTNHLDARYQHHIMEALTARGMTAVIVLHDLNLAAAYCPRIVMLDHGVKVADGPSHEVLQAQRVADVYGVRTRVMALEDRPHLILGR